MQQLHHLVGERRVVAAEEIHRLLELARIEPARVLPTVLPLHPAVHIIGRRLLLPGLDVVFGLCADAALEAEIVERDHLGEHRLDRPDGLDPLDQFLVEGVQRLLVVFRKRRREDAVLAGVEAADGLPFAGLRPALAGVLAVGGDLPFRSHIAHAFQGKL